MTDIPNCSTCPHKVVHSSSHNGCKISNTYLSFPAEVMMVYVGCLSHPGAREWMMRDVVKELKRLSNQNVGSQYKYALEEAIALIKGVK